MIDSLIHSNPDYPTELDYMRLLECFPLYGERGWKPNYLGDRHLGYFGDSGSGENGLRTMGNYIFTVSLLASQPDYDSQVSNVDQQILLERASSCLNYMTRSHITGDIPCGNGKKWGGGWQSAWWTTKMALGAKLIWAQLSADQQAAVERVVVFEANRHLDRIAPSGLTEDTKAEENAWDGEILATAIGLFPQHVQADGWRDKLIEFSINTLSAPQDRTSDRVIDGKTIKDQVYTVNIHSDYTLENHGACHFCYVASPLVSIAWSYYALVSNHQPVPEALFHHVEDLWQQVKSTFLDHRFAYIGGKDWARYTYGLYFIVPALVLLQHHYDDPDARTIEQLRIGTLASEHQSNKDGSFFGKRVTRNQMFGQSAKYETDCYADLGLAYLLHKQLNTRKLFTPLSELAPRLCGRNIGQEAGVCYVRTTKLFASFSWRTLTQPYPIALFIPSGMDDGAEWLVNNLLGRVRVLGVQGTVSIRMMKPTGLGFTVKGTVAYRTSSKEAFLHKLSYEVVPEKNWAIIESQFIARSQIVVLRQEGLRLAIANDFFNGYKRQYRWEDGSATITFDPAQTVKSSFSNNSKIAQIRHKVAKLLDLDIITQKLGRSWVNIDEKLGVVQLRPNQGEFNLRQEPGRNTYSGCLHFDILQNPPQPRYPQIRQAGDVLLHTKFLLLAGTASETEAVAANYNGV